MVVGLGLAADAHGYGDKADGIDAYVALVEVFGNRHVEGVEFAGLDVGEFFGHFACGVVGFEAYGYIFDDAASGVDTYTCNLRMAEDFRLGKYRDAGAACALDDVVHVGAVFVGRKGYGSHAGVDGFPLGHAHEAVGGSNLGSGYLNLDVDIDGNVAAHTGDDCLAVGYGGYEAFGRNGGYGGVCRAPGHGT